MNLPPERLVLAFGCGISAVAYVYWTVEAARFGPAISAVPAVRAGVSLGATVLLALVLRLVSLANRPPPDP